MKVELNSITKVVDGEQHIYKTKLELQAGSFNVLLGATLSGKTSLMRMIAGLDKPTSGSVSIDGKDMINVPLQQRNIGMVYQEFVNYPSFSVFDNIASPLKIKKHSKKDIDQKVRETAAMMGLDHLLDRYPSELSGGQQQRLALARALIKGTNLLLLDEPLVNLDYKLREKLRAELVDIIQKQNIVVVYSTTDPLEALMLGGTTTVLKEGKMIQSGPAFNVFNQPANVDVATIYNDPPMNFLDVKVEKKQGKMSATLAGGTKFKINGHLSDLPNGPYKLGFRCFHGSINQTNSSDLTIEGKVELAELSGSATYIHAKHNKHSVVIQEPGAHVYHIGDKVTFYIQTKNLFAFSQQGDLIRAPRTY